MKENTVGRKIIICVAAAALLLAPSCTAKKSSGPGAKKPAGFAMPAERPAPENTDPELTPTLRLLDPVFCLDTFSLYAMAGESARSAEFGGGNEEEMYAALSSLGARDEVWGGVFLKPANRIKTLNVQAAAVHFEAALIMKAAGADKSGILKKHLAKDAGYVLKFLAAPGGGFHRGQQADFVHEGKTWAGRDYYELGDKERRRLGMPPIVRKIDAGDNIMFAAALLEAADAADNAKWRETALAAIRFVKEKKLNDAERQLLVFGFLEAYQGTGDPEWLRAAVETELEMKSRMESAGPAAKDKACGETDFRESAAVNLHRLFHLTDDAVFGELLEKTAAGASFPEHIRKISGGYPLTVAVVGPAGDPATAELRKRARTFFEPNKVVMTLDPERDVERLAELPYQARPRPTLYACVETACSMPVSEPDSVQPQLRKFVDKYMYKKDTGLTKYKLRQ